MSFPLFFASLRWRSASLLETFFCSFLSAATGSGGGADSISTPFSDAIATDEVSVDTALASGSTEPPSATSLSFFLGFLLALGFVSLRSDKRSSLFLSAYSLNVDRSCARFLSLTAEMSFAHFSLKASTLCAPNSAARSSSAPPASPNFSSSFDSRRDTSAVLAASYFSSSRRARSPTCPPLMLPERFRPSTERKSREHIPSTDRSKRCSDTLSVPIPSRP